jgi:hypothetical protein
MWMLRSVGGTPLIFRREKKPLSCTENDVDCNNENADTCILCARCQPMSSNLRNTHLAYFSGQVSWLGIILRFLPSQFPNGIKKTFVILTVAETAADSNRVPSQASIAFTQKRIFNYNPITNGLYAHHTGIEVSCLAKFDTINDCLDFCVYDRRTGNTRARAIRGRTQPARNFRSSRAILKKG